MRAEVYVAIMKPVAVLERHDVMLQSVVLRALG